jgi:hypothetical protein
MDHAEIRFNILHYLYQKHYSNELGHKQRIDKIIEGSGLQDIHRNAIYGDVIFLLNKGLIEGKHYLGDSYPNHVKITKNGIDQVEHIIYQIGYDIKNSGSIVQVKKTQFNEILKNEGPSSKIQAAFQYIKNNPELFTSIFDKVTRAFVGK